MDVDDRAMAPRMASPPARDERVSKYFSQPSKSPVDLTSDTEGVHETTDTAPTEEQPAVPAPKKKGRKPKPRPEGEVVKPVKPRKPREPKAPKEPKPPKEPKAPKEKKVKDPKEPKVRKNAKNKQAGDSGILTFKSDRSILNYFDKTNAVRHNGPSTSEGATDSENTTDGRQSSPVMTKSGNMSFKQSCLSFDVIDSSNPGAYFLNKPYEDVNPFRHLLKELPKLVGRAPYEDLSEGMLARSARIPALRTFEVTFADLDMNTLAEVKMIHEFLNTFGIPLSLTEEEGEWITIDSLISMLRNPRIDDRLVGLHCRLVRAAYESEEMPNIDQYNFTYYLAVGPEALSGADDKRDAKTARALARAVRLGRPRKFAIRRKKLVLDRLGSLEFSQYTMTDRIQSLAKAIHDILSTPKFHRFMTNEVEENILTLKRQKRKRTEARKELEGQTQELEKSMREIERQAAELESQKQALLAMERDGTPGEDEQSGGSRGSASRLQRLAQTKEARAKVAALTNEQKALAHELKLKESICDSKREELEGVMEDDFEVQKDHNVILNRLRGGNVVNTDDNLRVMALGSDRFGRKYWFWKGFGGIIVEDRGQVGPKQEEDGDQKPITEPKVDKHDGVSAKTATGRSNSPIMEEVITKMESMADPELTGGTYNEDAQSKQDLVAPKAENDTPPKPSTTKDRMSINSLLIDTPNDTSEKSEPKKTVNGESKNPPSESQLVHQPPEYRRYAERDLLDYGPIQTWSLISTNKELASLIRVLNHKGVRERILKANLLTMRKQIEMSFTTVKKWAHVADANEPRNAADGDLILEALKKKRGRKSKEELAEIAARMESLEAHAAGQTEGEGELTAQPSEEMEVDLDIEYEQHGATCEEYYDGLVQQLDGKLCALSAVLCEGNKEDALSKFVSYVRSLVEEDPLKVTVGCLKLCLEALKENPEEFDGADDQQEQNDTAENEERPNDDQSLPAMTSPATKDTESDMDADEDEHDDLAHEESSTSIASKELLETIRTHPSVIEQGFPVLERPKLYWWLKARRIDEMLDAVQTYGGLHAWLELCKRAVESIVDEGDHGDDEDDDMHRSGDEDEDVEEADDHDHDGHDDDDAEEDEQADDDDEADDAADDKSQDNEEEDAEEDDEPRRGRSRYNKSKKQVTTSAQRTSAAATTRAATRSISNTTTTVGGISLRSRRGTKVNYSDDVSRFDHDDDEEEDEDDSTPRLRRSKRRRR
ncbi:hypothetical protein BGW42_008538 [Actinomortierella wolfii]|nr:hypothetical protein BGW42_008538 [Actinomortierella wolfii]